MIASHIFFENEIYQNIEAFTEDDGCRYFIGLGRTSSKQIEFSNIDLEENPFQEFIAIFRRKKIDDNKVCDWIRKYGFLNTTYGGISHSRKFEYNWFINEAKTITDLWIKYNETLNRDEDALKKWLIPGEDTLKAFLEESDYSTCSIYPSEHVRNGEYTSNICTVSYNKPIKDLTYREYAYSGFQYILLKITQRLKNVSLGFKKVTATDDQNLSLTSFVIDNSIIVPPDLLTALYLYFFQILHSNVRICPVCLKPFYDRRSDAVACKAHSNAYKKRKQRKDNQNKHSDATDPLI